MIPGEGAFKEKRSDHGLCNGLNPRPNTTPSHHETSLSTSRRLLLDVLNSPDHPSTVRLIGYLIAGGAWPSPSGDRPLPRALPYLIGDAVATPRQVGLLRRINLR